MKKTSTLGKSALGTVVGGWLLLLACGGAYERGGTGENGGSATSGGSASSGSASKPSSGGKTSSGQAGSQATGGTPTGVAGTTTMTPMPSRNPAPCFNDTDCPNSSCGGEVCNWTKTHPAPIADKVFVCDPAGLQAKGMDGWCTTDDNCKCRSLGARCIAPYCSFTKASDAPER